MAGAELCWSKEMRWPHLSFLRLRRCPRLHVCFLCLDTFLRTIRMASNLTYAVLCLVAQSCLTLCDPMDYIACQAPLSLGILQVKTLEWVAMPSPRGSSQPRDQTKVSHIAGRFFTSWATREAHLFGSEVKASACKAKDLGSIPGSGRFLGEWIG